MHQTQGIEKLREDPAKAGAATGLATAPQQPDQPGGTSQDMFTTAASGGPSRPHFKHTNFSVSHFGLPNSAAHANPSQCGEA